MTQHKRPCGRRFCPAVVRILHPIAEMTQAQIAAIIGISQSSFGRQSSWLGLPSRYEDHYKNVSKSRLRQLYEVENLTCDDIAARLGCHRDTVWRKAQSMGLRRATKNKYAHRIVWPKDFDQLWMDGVLITDIMAAATTDLTDVRCVSREARRRGLPPRKKAARWTSITLHDYRQITLARAMRQAARIEQAAMINAELVDKTKNNTWVGAQYARGLV